ncbi:5-formyltetrahydrofolate cyclo-ligase [Roseomonas terrae]|uniref:5-formyltetrahydrofolate cyclo-ligase n=1 Tax=Neoroseomonas terrae TaxID=424799 RepID=A0ABS5EC75_9PROT|nr:5-formyltetrahydrofolate cyclo-ligase [Neoroseomonas terrae]MBR0648560.1 5-formyltetrahydrofolate cyclo-ligase [Neoroseomonas terrae]
MPGRTPIAPPEEDPNVGILCASPPCFMHELDPYCIGPVGWEEVRAWRRAERRRLIACRAAVPLAERRARDLLITGHLRAALPDLAGRHIGFYWPFKGEYDPRPLVRALHQAGARLALPVVVERAQPMLFRPWWPGVRMMKGIWDIPVPAEGRPVSPDMLLVPLVGFDARGYRLGHGGGYYDRTLAAMPQRPRAIGIGFESLRLPSIHPQPHDIPMDLIVTEHGVREAIA